MDRKKSATVLGFVVIAVFMGLLTVLPEITRKKNYAVPDKSTPETLTKFPMVQKFRVLNVDGKKVVTPGKEVTLEEVAKGRDLIVNFWATWCPPCIEELPSLEMLTRQMRQSTNPMPLVVAISVDETVQEVKGLVQTLDFVPSFIVLHDPSGHFAMTVGTTKFPETYWIKADGKLVHKWPGPQEWLSRDVLSQLSRK